MSEHTAEKDPADKCPGVGCSCYGNVELHNLPSAENDTHREVAESMTGLWQAERERADRLEAMCDRLAERLAELPDLWSAEGRGVMFNRAGDDFTPAQRVGKWLHDKTRVSSPADVCHEFVDTGRCGHSDAEHDALADGSVLPPAKPNRGQS